MSRRAEALICALVLPRGVQVVGTCVGRRSTWMRTTQGTHDLAAGDLARVDGGTSIDLLSADLATPDLAVADLWPSPIWPSPIWPSPIFGR